MCVVYFTAVTIIGAYEPIREFAIGVLETLASIIFG